MSDSGSVTVDGRVIPYTVRRSKRRRRTISIALDGANGVVVAAPMRTPDKTIRDVVAHRAGWILRKSAEAEMRPQPLGLVTGETLPYFGRELSLVVDAADVRRVKVTLGEGGFQIQAPRVLAGDQRREAVHVALIAWYRKTTLEWIEERVAAWAEHMKCAPRRVLVRDQKQRWGSCAPDGTLRFNLRLAMSDPELIDYVVVHELIHLRVRNHGPTFWREFTRYLPDCKTRRTRLHDFGKTLRL